MKQPARVYDNGRPEMVAPPAKPSTNSPKGKNVPNVGHSRPKRKAC